LLIRSNENKSQEDDDFDIENQTTFVHPALLQNAINRAAALDYYTNIL
jgi:hypothetical protein